VFLRLVPVLVIAACARPPVVEPAAPTARDRLVVVLSIDGLPAYALADPRLPAPTLRRLIREGASAEGMTTINPTVTWPNHTTLATGVPANRHGVLYNGRLLRPGPRKPLKVEHRDRNDLVRVPTLYDAAHRAGLRTAQIDWVPHQTTGTISDAFAEVPALDGPIESEMVAAGFIRPGDLAEWKQQSITWRDQVWLDAASYMVTQRRSNLVYLHLLALDSTNHRYGPMTLASLTAIALADARVAQLLDAILAAGMGGRTTLFVVSDHGFKTVRHQIRANAALRAAGLIEGTGAELACDVWAVPEGGTAMVYLTNPDGGELLAARARAALEILPGVAQVIGPAGYRSLGLPLPGQNDQMADLLVAARPGYAYFGGDEGEPVMALPEGVTMGAHGYLAGDAEMNAVFIAWGHGIRPGARLGVVRNVDVAPTVAAVMGIQAPAATGRALREILK